MQKKKLTAIALIVVFIGLFFVQVNIAQTTAETVYDDVTLYPTMKLVLKGNYTLDESLALKQMSLGKMPIGKSDLGYVFAFNVAISPSGDLSTLSLDDLDETAIDPRDDDYGHEEVKIGAISFIGNPNYKIENDTDVDANDGEFYFYNTTTFDSDDYQYLLISDALTHGATSGKIVVNTSAGNTTLFNDVLSTVSTNDIWFRIDQHCNFLTVNNISVTGISYGAIDVFGLGTGRQWSDTRYHNCYVGGIDSDDLITGTYLDIASQERELILHEADYHIDNCNYEILSVELTDDDIVACRSPAWQESGYLRVSGWLDEDHLEEDLYTKIAAMEGVNTNDISTYAISNAIAFWEQKNSDVLDYFSEVAIEARGKFSDAQSYTNYVADHTMPMNCFLIDVDNDILSKGNQLENDGISAKAFWDDIKSAASSVFDTVTAGVASIGTGVGSVAEWGMDLVSGYVDAGTQTITGLLDTTGQIANNLVGAVATEGGGLNPMNFISNLWGKLGWWLVVLVAGIVGVIAFLAWAITKSVRVQGNVNY